MADGDVDNPMDKISTTLVTVSVVGDSSTTGNPAYRFVLAPAFCVGGVFAQITVDHSVNFLEFANLSASSTSGEGFCLFTFYATLV